MVILFAEVDIDKRSHGLPDAIEDDGNLNDIDDEGENGKVEISELLNDELI